MTDARIIKAYRLIETNNLKIKMDTQEDVNFMKTALEVLLKHKVRQWPGVDFDRYLNNSCENLPAVIWPGDGMGMFEHQGLEASFLNKDRYLGFYNRAISVNKFENIEKYTEYLI